MKNKRTESGFTLIELMIVVAIVGILASLALPAYSTYTDRAKFAEVIAATGPAKTAIEIAVQSNGITDEAELDDGTYGISAPTASGYVASVGTTDGKITATGITGLAYTYVLTAAISNGQVIWTPSGTCTAAGVC
jgi:type IV pilus assembly protein PilA